MQVSRASAVRRTPAINSYRPALVAEAVGDLQKSWNMVTRALNAFPDHADSIELRDRLVAEFITV